MLHSYGLCTVCWKLLCTKTRYSSRLTDVAHTSSTTFHLSLTKYHKEKKDTRIHNRIGTLCAIHTDKPIPLKLGEISEIQHKFEKKNITKQQSVHRANNFFETVSLVNYTKARICKKKSEMQPKETCYRINGTDIYILWTHETVKLNRNKKKILRISFNFVPFHFP